MRPTSSKRRSASIRARGSRRCLAAVCRRSSHSGRTCAIASSAAARRCSRSRRVERRRAPSRGSPAEHAVRRLVPHDARRAPRAAAGASARVPGRRAAAESTAPRRRRRSAPRARRRAAAAAATASASAISVVGVVHELGAAAQLHRHARAQLDVHDLVEREARGQRDQIERRARLDERPQRRRARGRRAVLLERGAGPRAARAATSAVSADAARVERAPRHRLDLGPRLAIAALDRAAEQLELEHRARIRACQVRRCHQSAAPSVASASASLSASCAFVATLSAASRASSVVSFAASSRRSPCRCAYLPPPRPPRGPRRPECQPWRQGLVRCSRGRGVRRRKTVRPSGWRPGSGTRRGMKASRRLLTRPESSVPSDLNLQGHGSPANVEEPR